MSSNYSDIATLLGNSKKVVIIQADNPDADSIGSALGLSEILNDQGIDNELYCAINTPEYLKYLSSWSLVNNELPKDFDTSIIVDASTMDLLEKIKIDKNYSKFVTSKKIVLDHHDTTNNNIDSDISIIRPDLSSTSELVYDISIDQNWIVSTVAGECLMTGILGDTQGLSNSLASPKTYRVVADLIENGVSREVLENKRRDYNKYTESIYNFKADLIKKTELHLGNKLAIIKVNQQEINSYSSQYNPSALIIPDILQLENLAVVCVLKVYDDGKVTGTVRSNSSFPFAAVLAEKLGGGGHDFASGFKISSGKNYETITNEIINITTELLG